jgi:peptide/nickel transport system permease protein
MLTYIVKRLLLLVPVILGITVLTFIISRVIPADPAQVAAGLEAGPDQVAALREEMGLDKPVAVQFIAYINGLLHGDLGRSMRSKVPVREDLVRYLPATFELAGVTILIYVLIGIPLGILSATYRGRVGDLLVRILSVLGTAMPVFWVGLLLQILLFGKLHWFPAIGRIAASVGAPTHITGLYLVDSLLTANGPAFASSLRYLFMPVTTLVFGRIAVAVRLTRASMVEVLDKDYITFARGKGLPERTLVLKHGLRNALVPIVTIVALQFAWLLGGTVLVEYIFTWPGIGQYAIEAIINLDYAPIMGIAVFMAIIFTVVNLLVDVLYCFLDPRIRW